MKHTIFWIAFGLFCILPIGIAFSQADMKVLSEEAFPDDQRPPAVFVHDEHNAKAKLYDCSVCHHVYKDGQKVQGAMSVGQGCSDCHSIQAGPDNSMVTGRSAAVSALTTPPFDCMINIGARCSCALTLCAARSR